MFSPYFTTRLLPDSHYIFPFSDYFIHLIFKSQTVAGCGGAISRFFFGLIFGGFLQFGTTVRLGHVSFATTITRRDSPIIYGRENVKVWMPSTLSSLQLRTRLAYIFFKTNLILRRCFQLNCWSISTKALTE